MPKGEFGRNVVTLMTGSTLAQAIPVAISPILTRMYGPKDFGLLALFVSLTTIFGAVANGRYELAILLPESDEDAMNIAALGTSIALGLSIILLIIAGLFNNRISYALGNENIGPWLYFVPLTVLFIGIFNALNYFNNRLKCYKQIAQANVYKALVLVVVQVSIGLVKVGALGLISGQIFSSALANVKLLRNALASVDVRSVVRWHSMKAVGRRYRNFPKYSMPAALANTLSQNLTNILVSAYYSVATLGFYSLTQRMLGMPTSLMGTSISQVFFQHATEEKRRTGKAIIAFDRTVKKLALVSVPIFTVMFFVVEDAFSVVFGDKWRVAGVYAKILIPFFAIRFVVSSVSNVNNVFEKQKIALAWQVGLLILSVGAIWLSHNNEFSFEKFLFVLSAVSSMHYALLYLIMRKVAKGEL